LKNFIRYFSVATFVLLITAPVCLAQSEPSGAKILNLHKVNDHLYRAGQPRPGDIKKLAEMGIKTIINLRGANQSTRAAEAEARQAGMAYFNIPMRGLARPSDKEIERVFAIINAPENWPVLIHCKRGSDRTGTVVAIYRMVNDGWSAREAIAEAQQMGMSWIMFGMRDYVFDYALKGAAGATSTAGATSAANSMSTATGVNGFARAEKEPSGFKAKIGPKIEAAARAAQLAKDKARSSFSWFFRLFRAAN
jgi:uncharacterized protein (TIGR01244 family)